MAGTIVRLGLLGLVVNLGAWLASPALGSQALLDSEQLQRINAATYEVVVKKIDEGGVEYEKPLPMDLLPYHIRNDDYWSIGTAFAIGPRTIVTAAHVFELHQQSQYDEFYLRDNQGRLYEPGEVRKFSGNRDFIVFSLKDRKVETYLPVNKNAKLNERIFAVGNAMGEGVVIRDGLYTSRTPEEDKGAWEWLRFSAAASPGNSGGPLLNRQGEVIGVVLRKSENENLNYALPIGEVIDAPDNLARHEVVMTYVLDNMEYRHTDRLVYEQALPLSLAKLNEALSAEFDRFSVSLFDTLMEKHKAEIFPNGEGSKDLLHSTYAASFPYIIWQLPNGKWEPRTAADVEKAELGHNGYMRLGVLKNTVLIQTRKPDNINYHDFLTDGKQYMDMLLHAVPITRNISTEKIRITSLGEPIRERRHIDRYQRKWQERVWYTPYDDSAIVTLSLPTPSGNVTMLRSISTGTVDDHVLDLHALADFFYISYYGTLSQWEEFLQQRDYIAEVHKSIKIEYESERYLDINAGDIALRYDNDLMKITPRSDLFVYTSYLKRDDDVAWDITRLAVGEDANNSNQLYVSMNLKPHESMDDRYKANWSRLVNKEFPYNEKSYFKDKTTHIGTRYDRAADNSSVLYSVFYSVEGQIDEKLAAGKLQRFMENIRIHRK